MRNVSEFGLKVIEQSLFFLLDIPKLPQRINEKINNLAEEERHKRDVELARQTTLREVLFRAADKGDPTLCIGRIEFLLGISDYDPHPEPQFKELFELKTPLLDKIYADYRKKHPDQKGL